nr:snRNA-activating protein complex subunit 5 isoform X1 [Anas platyrhynchos]
MLSRLQELRKEEETLLRVKAALHDQLTRLKVGRAAGGEERGGAGRPERGAGRVEELALQSMIRSREEDAAVPAAAAAESQETLGQMDNEAAINQTELQLSLQDHEEEEEEEEESDS